MNNSSDGQGQRVECMDGCKSVTRETVNPTALDSAVDMRSTDFRRLGELEVLRYSERHLHICLPDDFYCYGLCLQLDQM